MEISNERKDLYKIVEELYREGQLDAMIAPFYLHKDRELDAYAKEEFKQELCIILLKYKKPEKLIAAYMKRQLGYFILVIIKNQLKSVTSKFWRSHNRWIVNRMEYDLKNMERASDED